MSYLIWFKRFLWLLLALLVLLTCVVSIYVNRAFPALDGEMRAVGLGAPVNVARNDADWCGPRGCAGQSAAALDRALTRLQNAYGADAGKWTWGRAHNALSAHKPFGNVALLARFFDVRVATGGDAFTVNVGQYWANDEKGPFTNRHAASMRTLFDLSDLEKSLFIYQTGQSGLVFSSRYRDMSRDWARVEYRPLQMSPAVIAHQLTLKP